MGNLRRLPQVTLRRSATDPAASPVVNIYLPPQVVEQVGLTRACVTLSKDYGAFRITQPRVGRGNSIQLKRRASTKDFYAALIQKRLVGAMPGIDAALVNRNMGSATYLAFPGLGFHYIGQEGIRLSMPQEFWRLLDNETRQRPIPELEEEKRDIAPANKLPPMPEKGRRIIIAPGGDMRSVRYAVAVDDSGAAYLPANDIFHQIKPNDTWFQVPAEAS